MDQSHWERFVRAMFVILNLEPMFDKSLIVFVLQKNVTIFTKRWQKRPLLILGGPKMASRKDKFKLNLRRIFIEI